MFILMTNNGHNTLVSNSHHKLAKTQTSKKLSTKQLFNMTLSPFLVFLFCGTEVYTREVKKFGGVGLLEKGGNIITSDTF